MKLLPWLIAVCLLTGMAQGAVVMRVVNQRVPQFVGFANGPAFNLDGDGNHVGSDSLQLMPRSGMHILYDHGFPLPAMSLLGANLGTRPGEGLPWWSSYGQSISSITHNFLTRQSRYNHIGGLNDEVFLGFRLLGPGGVGFRYGYLEFNFQGWTNVRPNNFGPDGPLLVGWAYESAPDPGILVRSIPETGPGVLSLWAVCIGAGFRRRCSPFSGRANV